jgi:hypothetical protein
MIQAVIELLSTRMMSGVQPKLEEAVCILRYFSSQHLRADRQATSNACVLSRSIVGYCLL